mmetsp:Transcript_53611/g.125501  ORF Transcript_53611/g.125501 Transcript_53611/m.125501 type:complete len:359 (+) Transcript_53611:82-1158(+)
MVAVLPEVGSPQRVGQHELSPMTRMRAAAAVPGSGCGDNRPPSSQVPVGVPTMASFPRIAKTPLVDRREGGQGKVQLLGNQGTHFRLDPWSLCHFLEAHSLRWQEVNPRPTPTPTPIVTVRRSGSVDSSSSASSGSFTSSAASSSQAASPRNDTASRAAAPAAKSASRKVHAKGKATAKRNSVPKQSTESTSPTKLGGGAVQFELPPRGQPGAAVDEDAAQDRSRAGGGLLKPKVAGKNAALARAVSEKITQNTEAKRMANRLLGGLGSSAGSPAFGPTLSMQSAASSTSTASAKRRASNARSMPAGRRTSVAANAANQSSRQTNRSSAEAATGELSRGRRASAARGALGAPVALPRL